MMPVTVSYSIIRAEDSSQQDWRKTRQSESDKNAQLTKMRQLNSYIFCALAKQRIIVFPIQI
jgi:hypothetical protein